MADISQTFDPAVPVDQLAPHPRNVNQGDIGAIDEVMTQLGFFGACLVQQSTQLIIAGKHRWLAAQQTGRTTVPVLYLDVDDDSAIRIMLADNRTARLGMDDPRALSELLMDLERQAPRGLAGTGFDHDALDDLLADLAEHQPLRVGDDDMSRRPIPTGVMVRIGDYSGWISESVYAKFRDAYEQQREQTGEVMLDDVLAVWLGL